MIRSYFNATAEEILRKQDEDGYGDSVLEKIAENVSCRKLMTEKLTTDNKGNQVLSTVEVWLPASFEELPAESEIQFDGKRYKVIQSGFVPGLVTDLYLRVLLQ